MSERWLPVPGYEGLYAVSDLGAVRSLDRVAGQRRPRAITGRTLKPFFDKEGRPRICLSRQSQYRSAYVHQLVLEAFVGPRPLGYECCHRDDNPLNNTLENLYWGTHSENMRDQVRNGLHPQSRKLACPQNHPYSDENTYWAPGGYRQCRTCHRLRMRRNKTAA